MQKKTLGAANGFLTFEIVITLYAGAKTSVQKWWAEKNTKVRTHKILQL